MRIFHMKIKHYDNMEIFLFALNIIENNYLGEIEIVRTKLILYTQFTIGQRVLYWRMPLM